MKLRTEETSRQVSGGSPHVRSPDGRHNHVSRCRRRAVRCWARPSSHPPWHLRRCWNHVWPGWVVDGSVSESGTMVGVKSRISRTSCSRPSAMSLRAMAWAGRTARPAPRAFSCRCAAHRADRGPPSRGGPGPGWGNKGCPAPARSSRSHCSRETRTCLCRAFSWVSVIVCCRSPCCFARRTGACCSPSCGPGAPVGPAARAVRTGVQAPRPVIVVEWRRRSEHL